MKMKKIVIVIAGILLISSCNKGYKGFEKSDTGLYYQFHVENPTNHVPENGEVISLQMSIRTEKDSIVQLMKHIPIAMQNPKFKGDIYDALSMMHEGDSATFIINAKQYYTIYNYGQVPTFAKDEKTMLWFTLKIDSVLSFDEFQQAAAKAKYQQETFAIEKYLKDNDLECSPLENGLCYIETKKGKGNSPQQGQTCVMNYTGTFLNGDIFDSSIGRTPFEFQLGRGMVISGWDLAIPMMQKGGKAILVLPSYLAYGERGAGTIPSNTPLVFEVELLDVR